MSETDQVSEDVLNEILQHDNRPRLFAKNETYGYMDPSSFAAANVETPIPDTNRGYRLLQKMGWKKDQPLGKRGDGIVNPINLQSQDTSLGLGKATEYAKYNAEAARERKKLDVEMETTEETETKRKEKAEREEIIKRDIKEMHKEFYCEICDKQYKNVSEFSNHLSSYDHHHTKRFREMKEAEKQRSTTQKATKEKRKREQRREEMEMMKRIQAATGTHDTKDSENHSENKELHRETTAKAPVAFGFVKKKLPQNSSKISFGFKKK